LLGLPWGVTAPLTMLLVALALREKSQHPAATPT